MYPVPDIAAVEVAGKEMFLVLDLLLLGKYIRDVVDIGLFIALVSKV